jgi:hypothetical protein
VTIVPGRRDCLQHRRSHAEAMPLGPFRRIGYDSECCTVSPDTDSLVGGKGWLMSRDHKLRRTAASLLLEASECIVSDWPLSLKVDT